MIEFLKSLFDGKRYDNPLSKPHMRNKYCICDSGYKVKVCCGLHSNISRREWLRIKKLFDKKLALSKR